MKSLKTARSLALLTIALLGVLTMGTALAQAHGNPAGPGSAGTEVLAVASNGFAAPYYAAAAVMGVACMSAAYAVGKVGAAALGAAAEKPELLGKAIVFVGLGEGIAIFGLIISMMLINRAS
jgi:V/A-type H+-transporting ATPase subunit K